MLDETRQDIRKLLRTFGVNADEAITAHLEQAPGDQPLRLKIILSDETDYGVDSPTKPLHVEVSGEVSRS
jgi:hypothetical protein